MRPSNLVAIPWGRSEGRAMSTRCAYSNSFYIAAALMFATGSVATMLWQSVSWCAISLMLVLGILVRQLQLCARDGCSAFPAAPKPKPAAPRPATPTLSQARTLHASTLDSSSPMQASTPGSSSPMQDSSRCLHREFTTKGSNQYYRRWTCLACGAVWKDAPPPQQASTLRSRVHPRSPAAEIL